MKTYKIIGGYRDNKDFEHIAGQYHWFKIGTIVTLNKNSADDDPCFCAEDGLNQFVDWKDVEEIK